MSQNHRYPRSHTSPQRWRQCQQLVAAKNISKRKKRRRRSLSILLSSNSPYTSSPWLCMHQYISLLSNDLQQQPFQTPIHNQGTPTCPFLNSPWPQFLCQMLQISHIHHQCINSRVRSHFLKQVLLYWDHLLRDLLS